VVSLDVELVPPDLGVAGALDHHCVFRADEEERLWFRAARELHLSIAVRALLTARCCFT
jgi:hypothetical protein